MSLLEYFVTTYLVLLSVRDFFDFDAVHILGSPGTSNICTHFLFFSYELFVLLISVKPLNYKTAIFHMTLQEIAFFNTQLLGEVLREDQSKTSITRKGLNFPNFEII